MEVRIELKSGLMEVRIEFEVGIELKSGLLEVRIESKSGLNGG